MKSWMTLIGAILILFRGLAMCVFAGAQDGSRYAPLGNHGKIHRSLA